MNHPRAQVNGLHAYHGHDGMRRWLRDTEEVWGEAELPLVPEAYFDPAELGRFTTHDAILGHGPVAPGEPPPCARLSDGTGVWIRLGNPNAGGAKDYCPSHHPVFY